MNVISEGTVDWPYSGINQHLQYYNNLTKKPFVFFQLPGCEQTFPDNTFSKSLNLHNVFLTCKLLRLSRLFLFRNTVDRTQRFAAE